MKRLALVSALSVCIVPVLASPASAVASPNPNEAATVHGTQGCQSILENIERNPDILFNRSETGLANFTAVGEAFGCI